MTSTIDRPAAPGHGVAVVFEDMPPCYGPVHALQALPIDIAHRLSERLAEVRQRADLDFLLPAGKTTPALAEQIFMQLLAACSEVGGAWIGGHTEITHGLDRPIAVGTMLGEVAPERLVRSDGACPGDRLLLTKGIAIEGSAILARELAPQLRARVTADVLARAAGFLHTPGISVVREAQLLAALEGVHAMHDPTEGGVATGIQELVGAAGCLLYTSPSPRDRTRPRMPSSA